MSDALSVQVAANVRAMRRKRKLTQAALADALAAHGVTVGRNVLANIETGRRVDVSVDELAAFAAVFDVEPWSLTKRHVVCLNCGGQPHLGFTCRVCGVEG